MTSKQAKAKETQGYTLARKDCNSCKHLRFDLVMPAWMAEANIEAEAYGKKPKYLDSQRLRKNSRCSKGEFAVKATATCTLWEGA